MFGDTARTSLLMADCSSSQRRRTLGHRSWKTASVVQPSEACNKSFESWLEKAL